MITKINLVSCHKKPERSFFWKGKQFPFCARCTGIYIGYLVFPFFLLGLFFLPFYYAIILILPTLLDGLTQAYCNRESNNFIRVTTGFLAGVGCMSIVSLIGNAIGYFIKHVIF